MELSICLEEEGTVFAIEEYLLLPFRVLTGSLRVGTDIFVGLGVDFVSLCEEVGLVGAGDCSLWTVALTFCF